MRPSLPDAPAPDAAPSVPDDRVTVEAESAQSAIAQLHQQLGADARIVAAEKVLRGGRWGFFQKEMVQLTAEAPHAVEADPDDVVRRAPSVAERLAAARAAARDGAEVPADAPAAGSGGGLEQVLARLSAHEDAQEGGLGEALRRHLGVEIEEDGPAWPPPPAAAAAPRVRPARVAEPAPEPPVGLAAALATVRPPSAPTVGLPLEDVEYARGSGAPWSGRGLLMLGLPRGFVDAVLAQGPADDAAWTYAVARVLTPLCRPMPTGPAVLAGPRAERLSRALGVPLVRMSAAPRGTATFAVACGDSGRARTWLATHRRQRWTHLVVGGSDWRGLVFEDPLAVSWVGDDALGEAVRTAFDLGLVLGPGLDGDGRLLEPVPIELAMRLREQLGGAR